MSFGEFHFIRPYWLLALIPTFAVIVMLFRSRLGRGSWASVCDAALLPYLLQEKAAKGSRHFLLLGSAAALLAIAALAGPTFQRLPSPVFRNDSALVIALDLSRSMDAEDMKPSRLTRARYKIADLLRRRKDGQTALLVFADDAFTVTPLTDDTETIASQLEALTADIMPAQGDRAEAALNLSVQLLRQAGLLRGEILLITDGVDADAALAAAKKLHSYRLSVLGVGTAEGAPIALPSGGFLKDKLGAIVVPKLDPEKLAALADAGGGVYRTMTADDGDLESLLADLDTALPETEGRGGNPVLIDLWDDLGPWLVLAVLPLAAFSFRRGLLCAALVVLLPFPEDGYAVDWQDLWRTKDQQAAEAFAQERYERAAELFENPDWKAAAQYKADLQESGEMKTPKTAVGFYNQGNVLAKSNRLEEAVKAYDKALEMKPDFEDAKYNKKLVEDELNRQKQQQNQPSSDQPQDSEEDSKQEQENSPQDESDSGQKPEQKNESENPESEEQAEEKPEAGKEKEPEKAPEQQKQTDSQPAGETSETAEDDRNPDPSRQDQALTQPMPPSDETARANEQWLKRIPDDPAGLLKRKFKYQYSQRRKRSE